MKQIEIAPCGKVKTLTDNSNRNKRIRDNLLNKLKSVDNGKYACHKSPNEIMSIEEAILFLNS